MVLISKNFLIENLSVRFAIPVISVIFKNSAAVTNTRPHQMEHSYQFLFHPDGFLSFDANIIVIE